MEVKVVNKSNLRLPEYATPGSSGCDLRNAGGPVRVLPHDFAFFPTGIKIEMPEGYEAQVRGRSGLCRRGIIVPTGTIDSDYRGELGITLFNLSNEEVRFETGDRIAQLVFAKVEQATWKEVSELGSTERAEKGFSSSGLK